MSKIYKDQSSLRITLKTGVDITGANALVVRAKKPSSTTTVPVIVDLPALSENDSTGQIYHDFIDGELDESGKWTFWAYVTFADGRSAPGEPVTVTVYEEGK